MNPLKHSIIAALLALAGASSASAAVIFDQDVTNNVIMGTGITNGSFTVDRANGIELGLRGKLRHDATGAPQNTFNSNGDGTYGFDAGVATGQSFPTAVWSFEWSINSDFDGSSGAFLDDLTYELGIDTNPGAGTTFGTLVGGLSNPFDPINGGACADHSIGTNATPESGGAEADCGAASGSTDYAALIAGNNLAQNSWKPHWFIDGFDPTVDGRYDFYLAAFDGSTQLARTDISIIVGTGAAVPEPATASVLGLALAGLGFARRRRSG